MELVAKKTFSLNAKAVKTLDDALKNLNDCSLNAELTALNRAYKLNAIYEKNLYKSAGYESIKEWANANTAILGGLGYSSLMNLIKAGRFITPSLNDVFEKPDRVKTYKTHENGALMVDKFNNPIPLEYAPENRIFSITQLIMIAEKFKSQAIAQKLITLRVFGVDTPVALIKRIGEAYNDCDDKSAFNLRVIGGDIYECDKDGNPVAVAELAQKADKSTDKADKLTDKADKSTDKTDKPTDKPTDKTDKPTEYKPITKAELFTLISELKTGANTAYVITIATQKTSKNTVRTNKPTAYVLK